MHTPRLARIVGAMVRLIAVAFSSALTFSAQILTARTNAMLNERLTHAATSFRTFCPVPDHGRYTSSAGFDTAGLEQFRAHRRSACS
ncbi:hypothetical protein AOC05_09865 [Arthrobacter alpinus]|uniref:Uncharacterized protein n=1 Tax=Arthrobacter alpinus TaxID=656366 RepID=A0A0M4QYT3_9MICC|nr:MULTISPECIES: hypothetical protein [Arthrobacter]ALE92540.1 hypothetical protein AOC05_09865 [Arthrobacter alpinus]